MTDTAKRFSGPTLLTASAADQYTVPASTTAIIRNIHVAEGNGSATSLTLSIGTDALAKRLFSAVSIPANNILDLPCFIVLSGGEKIQAFASATNSLVLTVSGVEVS